jgi:hypothetical protein
MPLTYRQREALGVLDWLLDQDGQRQTGRTFVLAVSLIRQAIRRSPQPIYLIDHNAPQSRMGLRVIRDMVLHLTESDPHLMGRAHIDVRDDRFSIQPLSESRHLPDGPSWLPPESVLEVMAGNIRSRGSEWSTAVGLEPLVKRTRWERLLADELSEPSE